MDKNKLFLMGNFGDKVLRCVVSKNFDIKSKIVRGFMGVICDVIIGFFENIRIIPLNDHYVAKNYFLERMKHL